jgi:hypothetical protein
MEMDKLHQLAQKYQSKGCRVGQSYMNAINDIDVIVYNSIPKTADCFYDDSKLQNFFEYIENINI